MKQYFKNLFLALIGCNPFELQLDEMRTYYQKTAERVTELDEMYHKLQEALSKKEKTISDYQNLTENLRSRITEKDVEYERMKKHYQERIKQYTEEIDTMKNRQQEG